MIPDVIDGDEEINDVLVADWPFTSAGVPVWHMHEPVSRLCALAESWPRVALGSSGKYAAVGSPGWWDRMDESLNSICRGGSPITKLHGLRMLNPKIFSQLPLASADSTNVARNIGIDSAWKGTKLPPHKAARGIIIAERIESVQSAPTYSPLNLSSTSSRVIGVGELTGSSRHS